MKFSIGFLDQRHPYFVELLAFSKNWLAGVDITRNAFVDKDINPLEVLEKAEHIQAYLPELVEDWRVDSFGEQGNKLWFDNHVLLISEASFTAYKELVSHCKFGQCRDEPAVAQVSLDTVTRGHSVVNELCILAADVLCVEPLNFPRVRIAFSGHVAFLVKTHAVSFVICLSFGTEIKV